MSMGSANGADVDRAREIVARARRLVVFTGAGMSADSGLDTYRDAVTGVWENVDPQAMASIDAWARDPEPMWAWYLWRAALARRAEPNAGHLAVAGAGRVITQNIDDLHERAGSRDVIHLHGSLFAFRCCMCGRPWRGQVELPDTPVERLRPPECPRCGNLIRPGVVWFGEALPPRAWQAAEEELLLADAVVIVGTSGVVYPAASLPMLAARRHVPIIEVSPQETELTPLTRSGTGSTGGVFVRGRAAQILPRIFDV